MTPLIRNRVPLQGTRDPLAPTGVGGDLFDPQHNTDAIKALGYFLGADLVGLCEAEPWMYCSHDEQEGKPIAAHHQYAVAMLIDQGFETMEGASGDDWIARAVDARLRARRADRRPDVGARAAHGLVGAGALKCAR